jgi:hypothetical protein
MANGNFQVTNVMVRQSPRLDATGKVFTSTVLSFYVGPHGPFTVTFGPGQATTAQIMAVITSTVNQLIDQAQQINQLNQTTANQTPQA